MLYLLDGYSEAIRVGILILKYRKAGPIRACFFNFCILENNRIRFHFYSNPFINNGIQK